MPSIWIVLLLCLLKSDSCCWAEDRISPKIVGGQMTTLSAAGGFVVNLRYDGQFYCGGSLVAPQFVVTAAHCLKGSNVNRITVQGGVTFLTDRGIIRRAYKTMIPRKFNNELLTMDVGVVKLLSPMQGVGITTVPLCTVQWYAGNIMRVSGWGKTNRRNSRSIQLKSVQLQLITKTTCERMYRNIDRLYGTMFCARAQGKDTCTGDSGGGVIFDGQLCGIVSFGEGCADPRYPGVYTSVHRVRSFILNAMRK